MCAHLHGCLARERLHQHALAAAGRPDKQRDAAGVEDAGEVVEDGEMLHGWLLPRHRANCRLHTHTQRPIRRAA